MTPDDYCREKAENSGSSFYYSFLFLPAAQRRAITALYAFCREVDDIVDSCNEPDVARAKLHWWHEEVDRVYDAVPQHPVSRALAPVVDRYDIGREYLHEVIDGMEMDLDHGRYPTFKALSVYCHRVAGVVGLMSASIFGYEDHNTLRYAHDLGVAFQLTNILRDIREDAGRGRIYIPDDELARYCVTAEDIRAGNMTDGMRELLKAQARRVHDYYAKAFTKLPEADRYRQRSGVIMARIYQELLRRIENTGYPVLERRVTLSPWRKLWIAWNTARRETRRRRRFEKLAPRT